MTVDLDAPVRQTEFAELVGITQPAVSQLQFEGTLKAGEPLRAWLLAYCHRLREQAAGRATSNGLSLADERAALAKAQRERVERENAIARGELRPVGDLELALASSWARGSAILEAVPTAIKRAAPEASPRVLEIVEQEISRARNEIADLALPLELQLDQARGGGPV